MKVTCEYCGSYVEADENELCPRCLAPLKDAIRAEEERLAAERAASEQAAAEAAEKERKQQQTASVIKGVASVLLGGLTMGRRRQAHHQPPQPPQPPKPPRPSHERRTGEPMPHNTRQAPPRPIGAPGGKGPDISGSVGHRHPPTSGPRHRGPGPR